MWQTRRRLGVWVVCGLLVLACGSAGSLAQPRVEPAASAPHGRVLLLDLRNRDVVQPIGPAMAAPEKQKFVQVEIAEVFNPAGIRVAFDVDFQPAGGEKIRLGTFTIFPLDNPGTFLVATQGRLRAGGSIVVSMVVLDAIGPQDELRVKLRGISLRDGSG